MFQSWNAGLGQHRHKISIDESRMEEQADRQDDDGRSPCATQPRPAAPEADQTADHHAQASSKRRVGVDWRDVGLAGPASPRVSMDCT